MFDLISESLLVVWNLSPPALRYRKQTPQVALAATPTGISSRTHHVQQLLDGRDLSRKFSFTPADRAIRGRTGSRCDEQQHMRHNSYFLNNSLADSVRLTLGT